MRYSEAREARCFASRDGDLPQPHGDALIPAKSTLSSAVVPPSTARNTICKSPSGGGANKSLFTFHFVSSAIDPHYSMHSFTSDRSSLRRVPCASDHRSTIPIVLLMLYRVFRPLWGVLREMSSGDAVVENLLSIADAYWENHYDFIMHTIIQRVRCFN